MYFHEVQTVRGTFAITDIYKKGRKVYRVDRKLSGTWYAPAFPGIVFGTYEAALKAIEKF